MRALETEPRQEHLEALTCLPDILREVGYTEQALRELLQVPDLCLIYLLERPAYRHYANSSETDLARLARLFLTRGRLAESDGRRILGDRVVQTLAELGMVRLRHGYMAARVDLFPCQDAFLFTEPGMKRERYPDDHVYHLGADSYSLARLTPRVPNTSAVDLCTGSGVHAILAAAHSQHVLGVDRNPRALRFSRLNAVMNGTAEGCEFVLGDLWQPVPPGLHQLVTANPPFVPTPDQGMQIYRTGGVSGEELTCRLVGELPQRLAQGGTLAMIVDYPELDSSRYVDRLETWLGAERGWGIAVVDLLTRPNRVYISQHVGYVGCSDWMELETRFNDYLVSYDQVGIVQMRFGIVLIRRLASDWANWKVESRLRIEPVDRCQMLRHWLAALELTRAPDWPGSVSDWSPRLKPSAHVLLDHRGAEGVAHGVDAWPGLHTFTHEQAGLATTLDGSRSLGELGPEGVEAVRLLCESLLVELPRL